MPVSVVLPRFNFVLEKSIAEALPFKEICTLKGCPDRGIKVCPKVLAINGRPMLGYRDFLRVFLERKDLLDPSISHLTFPEEPGPLEYLVYFAEKNGFRGNAAEIVGKTACFHPAYSPQNT